MPTFTVAAAITTTAGKNRKLYGKKKTKKMAKYS